MVKGRSWCSWCNCANILLAKFAVCKSSDRWRLRGTSRPPTCSLWGLQPYAEQASLQSQSPIFFQTYSSFDLSGLNFNLFSVIQPTIRVTGFFLENWVPVEQDFLNIWVAPTLKTLDESPPIISCKDLSNKKSLFDVEIYLQSTCVCARVAENKKCIVARWVVISLSLSLLRVI